MSKNLEQKLSPAALARHSSIRKFYESVSSVRRKWSRRYSQLLAPYFRRYCTSSHSVLEVGCGAGDLLSMIEATRKHGIDLSPSQVEAAGKQVPEATFATAAGETFEAGETYDRILLANTLNQAGDAYRLLKNLHHCAHSNTRLVLNIFNNVWRPVIGLFRILGVLPPQPPSSWLSSADAINLLEIAGWEVIQRQGRIIIPFPLGIVGDWINRWIAPILSPFCLTVFLVAKPRRSFSEAPELSVSVIVPVRNEAGNIAAAVERTPEMGAWMELIFVEGHSHDQTWEEVKRVQAAYPERRIQIAQQSGKGKRNAVWEGYAMARGDILMILDGDLTVPPEELPSFYEVLSSGRGDFVNGVRLVYPREEESMRFLNMLANHAFALLFSWLLGQRIKDTLCGTKVFLRSHLMDIDRECARFDGHDPYGDFDLIMGSAAAGMKIVDIPVNYMARAYGTTQINRWSGGMYLLRSMWKAARYIKFVAIRQNPPSA